MNDEILDNMADDCGDRIAKNINYLDSMQIAAGYRQGFIKGVQIALEHIEANLATHNISAETILGHDLMEITKLPY